MSQDPSAGTVPAPLTEAVADALRAAYYYAVADGHPVVDPGLVLMAAARNDAVVAGPVLGGAAAQARDALRAARSGPAAASAPSVIPARAGDLREARWWVLRANGPADRADPAPVTSVSGGPVWDDAVGVALDGGGTVLGMGDLIRGLLGSGHPSVPALTALAGFDVAAARARLDAGGFGDEPVQAGPFLGAAGVIGALEESGLVARGISGLAGRMLRGSAAGGPVLVALEQEAVRQAVRLGQSAVRSSTLVLAVLSADEQLAAGGRALRRQYRPGNRGGELLRSRGITLASASRVAAEIEAEGDLVAPERTAGRLGWTYTDADPGWTDGAWQVWEAGAAIARRAGTACGTSHLVEALIEAPPPAARELLAALGQL